VVQAKSRAICPLKALIVTAPTPLRDHLRKLKDAELLPRCARLRTTLTHSSEHRATVLAIRATARRALNLEAEADDIESHIQQLVHEMAPQLLQEYGVGGS
jgi:hypothetical protein